MTFTVGAPTISFANCPEINQQKNFIIQGNVGGFNENAKLYINDQEVYLGYSKSFSKSVTLNDGDNSFVFRAVNSYGKTCSVAKSIKYISEKPRENGNCNKSIIPVAMRFLLIEA